MRHKKPFFSPPQRHDKAKRIIVMTTHACLWHETWEAIDAAKAGEGMHTHIVTRHLPPKKSKTPRKVGKFNAQPQKLPTRIAEDRNKKIGRCFSKSGQFRSNADTTRASRVASVRQTGRWDPNGRVQAREKYSKVLIQSQSKSLE